MATGFARRPAALSGDELERQAQAHQPDFWFVSEGLRAAQAALVIQVQPQVVPVQAQAGTGAGQLLRSDAVIGLDPTAIQAQARC